MQQLSESIRELLIDFTGASPNRPVKLPDGLPDVVYAIAMNAVPALTEYQDAAYARLFLDRLKRFIGRRDVPVGIFAEIARLMADRMMYEDPIRIAQLTLRDCRGSERVCHFRLDEQMSFLPKAVAVPVLNFLQRVGWSDRKLNRRFTTGSRFGVYFLRIEASLRRWRRFSARHKAEHILVARWLHMTDRALAKQPMAAPAMVETATMLQGYGDKYYNGLVDWHLIIDQLAKPTFDRMLPLDLTEAIARARAATTSGCQQASLEKEITRIRKESAGFSEKEV